MGLGAVALHAVEADVEASREGLLQDSEPAIIRTNLIFSFPI